MSLLNIKDLEKKVPGTHFLRVHKSYIVAIDQISAIEGNQILLKDTLKRRSGIPP
uniref:LytTR family DNA-binding domain-containing protein n=1 Tax=Roseihalotalea indica TaxID=2867963 RepID=A0AA49PZT2_9BACT|nr:LytTR family DNA-binding domain-containing protein [Tunicatimonas sp. TK19036]